MRLIDAEELAKSIKTADESLDVDTFTGRGKHRGFEHALAIIESTPTATNWTRMEDATPKKRGYYIVAYNHMWGGKKKDDIKVGTCFWHGKNGWGKQDKMVVIAWMAYPELPEPPKMDGGSE